MLRCKTSSCTCSHLWCYVVKRLHALVNIFDVTLYNVFLHLLTCFMLRSITSSCTTSFIWLGRKASNSCNAFVKREQIWLEGSSHVSNSLVAWKWTLLEFELLTLPTKTRCGLRTCKHGSKPMRACRFRSIFYVSRQSKLKFCFFSKGKLMNVNAEKITAGTQALDKCWDYCKDFIPKSVHTKDAKN